MERVLYRTAQGLIQRGHEVHLFCGEFRVPPPEGTFEHHVPCLSWPRIVRLLTFAYLAPKVMERHGCDAVMSFDRMLRQDLFRSGGGPIARSLRRWLEMVAPYVGYGIKTVFIIALF